MAKDKVLFDVTDEYSDEDNNVFKASLQATKYGYSFEVSLNGKLLYNETQNKHDTEGLKLDLPKDITSDDKRKYCIDCYDSIFRLGSKIANNDKIEATMNSANFSGYQIIASGFFRDILLSLQKETQPDSKKELLYTEKSTIVPADNDFYENIDIDMEIKKTLNILRRKGLIAIDKNIYYADETVPKIVEAIRGLIRDKQIKYPKENIYSFIKKNILGKDRQPYKRDYLRKVENREAEGTSFP